MGAVHTHPANISTTTCSACQVEGHDALQRMRRGFADNDVWNLDLFLARLIADTTAVLADNLHGCPPELCPEGDDWADEGVKRWRAILLEMSAGFRAYDRDEDLGPSLELLRKWWPHLWD